MQRLHINFMVNETYMDLRTNLNIPDAYRDTVRRYAVNEDCMLENAPGVMTFFTTRSDDEPAITFFSRTDRHTTTVSVGRFSQCFGWDWGLLVDNPDDKLKQYGPSAKFVDILDEGFYTEAELNPIAAADTNVLPPEKKRADLPEVVLAPQAKKAILTAAMLRWLRSDPVIRIAVPKDVDYDGYVIAAMKQIYALCPLGLQAVAGFCSYMPDPEKAIPQVYFGFIPQEMADTKTLFLDDSNQSALAVYADGTRRDGLDRFINYICSCNEADLQEFMDDLYTDVEAQGKPEKVFVLGTRNYQAVGDGLRIMSIQGTPEELLKEWQNFYDNIGRYSEKMQRRIKKHIAATADTEAIVALYTKGLQDATDPETVLRGLRTYNALCGDCPVLANALWNAAIARLQEGGTPTAKISEAAKDFAKTLNNLVTEDRLDGLYFLATQSRLQKLLDEVPQETAAVVTLSEKLQTLEKELQGKQPQERYEPLLEKLREKLAGLQEQQGDIAFMSLCKQLADLEKKPVENLSQIQDVISRSKFLEKKVCELPQDERAAQLLEKVKNFRKQLEELEHSSFTDLNEILLAINSAGDNYFTAMNKVDLTRLRKLDANQYKQVMTALDEKRPPYMSAYTAAFQKTCGKLALPVLAKQNEFVLSRIMSDLAQFNYMTIPYEKGLDEKVWEKKLTRTKLLAREILGQEKGSEQIYLSIDGADYEYEFFQRLANKRLKDEDGAGMEQKTVLESAVMSLITLEVFHDARDLDYLVRRFDEYEMSFQKLFARVLLGFFGTDPKGNANAFNIMAKSAAKRHNQPVADAVRAMIRISEDTPNVDERVLKQFQAFADKLVEKDDDPFADDQQDEPDDRGDRRSRGRGGKFEAPEKKRGWFGR